MALNDSEGAVVTIGVDLSAQAMETAACVLTWADATCCIEHLVVGLDDDAIVDLVGAKRPVKIGIDAPFGWPVPFVQAVTSYTETGEWPASAGNRRWLRLRSTDIATIEETGGPPPLGGPEPPRNRGKPGPERSESGCRAFTAAQMSCAPCRPNSHARRPTRPERGDSRRTRGGCRREGELRGHLLAGNAEMDVALDDLNHRRARRADRVAGRTVPLAVGLDRVVELDLVDVAAAAERRERGVDASEAQLGRRVDPVAAADTGAAVVGRRRRPGHGRREHAIAGRESRDTAVEVRRHSALDGRGPGAQHHRGRARKPGVRHRSRCP